MKPKYIIIIDVGSTFTKAHFVEDDLFVTQYAKTTVEKPAEDVMIGVRNAIRGIEEKTGRKFLDGDKIIIPFLATSSAGGGLQMLVAGLVRRITADSAERAALSAGAIIMDVLAIDDGRTPYDKIGAINYLRPDMILFAGGEEGGAVSTVTGIAEIISMAKPKGRFVEKIPLVYAGNKDAREFIQSTLGKVLDVYMTENVRPRIDIENPVPAREKIHELFMEHVMERAPGYEKLKELVSAPILPTPGAMSRMVKNIAKNWHKNVLCVDLGGATTDVFSCVNRVFNRTVSANLGMSYSMGNVLHNAGVENVMRWIPPDIDEDNIKDEVANKMLDPTKIPKDEVDMMIEEALAREAIRLAFRYHKNFAEAKRAAYLVDKFASTLRPKKSIPYVMAKVGRSEMKPIEVIIGSGGALSYARKREDALLILLDGLQPTGITEMGLDNRFMLPHLGALDQIHPDTAWDLFERFCFIPLATCIAPPGKVEYGKTVLHIRGDEDIRVSGGEILKKRLNGEYEIIFPGKKTMKIEIHGDAVLDGRGRPIRIPEEKSLRTKKLLEWRKALS
ncbi:hypothetical protein CH333_06045 [candidate division WOR-3 bacterium JGI_Cruoil_03_44_89]|uniref:Methylaspartate mutase n=1 Tax=candidate division WOR-3 bacterium JGI_Cruoil_03_44_89 TaxID=1973748 RepID=A0A235BSY0_UNCW3|nr:MAG: hypothetical protein CH333_06045 [candidate division WOR-3 bacterium JGI_Cruoil_03_44_89]